jgi:hypothetical protein
MIPTSALFDQSTLTALLDHDPVVTDYRAFFSLLDWTVVEHWEAARSSRGRPAHPMSAYLKAFLIRIREGHLYTTQLRRFLLKHPLLLIDLGFHLVLDPSLPYGFDPEQSLPCDFWFRTMLRTFDPTLLQMLLQATVRDLGAEIPGLGEVVSFDIKHIYAWVKENNLRVYVPDRYDKTHRPSGDSDCRLGVKKGSNQKKSDPASLCGTDPTSPPASSETKERKESLWGYGSGVAAATTAEYGDVVLAETTRPFNENDITHFESLYQQATLALGQFPTHLTADAAFDAWYVYHKAALHGGIAAIPLNQHGHPTFPRTDDGTPVCPKGLPMSPSFTFQHTNGYQALRFRCPLLHPTPTHQTCDHAQFLKGRGCVKDVNWELGGLMRVTLDRDGPLYHALYTQRSACERINSQAKELGIEQPKVRNRRSVASLNSFIYLVINLRALLRVRSINAGLLSTPKGDR